MGSFTKPSCWTSWPEKGPELLWTFEGLGRGFAAPAVSEDKIYINGEVEGNTYLFALDLNGKLLWKSLTGKEFLGEGFSSTYPGARSTPTVYGKMVYTSSGKGQIGCFDTQPVKNFGQSISRTTWMVKLATLAIPNRWP